MVLKFYTSVVNRLKLKFRKFWGVIRTFVEVTGEKRKTGREPFCPPSPPQIVNRVKVKSFSSYHFNTKKNGSFSEKQKCLIPILDCYNVKLNTGTLPRSKMELFQTTIAYWKLITFVARHFI